MIIFTDVIGRGGVNKGQAKAGDNWTPTKANNHVNYLDYTQYSLSAFKENIKDAHIKVMCGNTKAGSCITHMGTSHSDL